MREKPVDPRTRWVFHVIGQLVVGDQVMAIDRCVVVNYRMDHERNVEALRAQIVGSVNAVARDEHGTVVVGAAPKVNFVYAQHPKLVRTYLDESAQQQAAGPVLVQ